MFSDSRFLASAWRQLLETLRPDDVVFKVNERSVLVREVLLVLEGRKDPTAAKAMSDFFQQSMLEAMKIVRGRFALGLDSSAGPK